MHKLNIEIVATNLGDAQKQLREIIQAIEYGHKQGKGWSIEKESDGYFLDDES